MELQKHLGWHRGGTCRKQWLRKKAAGTLVQLSGKAYHGQQLVTITVSLWRHRSSEIGAEGARRIKGRCPHRRQVRMHPD